MELWKEPHRGYAGKNALVWYNLEMNYLLLLLLLLLRPQGRGGKMHLSSGLYGRATLRQRQVVKAK